MPKWATILFAVVGVSVIVMGAGAWVQRNEDDMETLQSHLKESCYAMCIQRCQRWCESMGIAPKDCHCADNCEKECG